VSALPQASSPHESARERAILRDLAHALVRADRATVVHQLALERVTPWIGASFSSVFLRDEDPDALTLAAAHRWPARFRDWIGALRVRVGSGPSGVAVGDGRLVEIADLFEDPELAGWHAVARELEFRSILAAPLRASHGVLGAMTFYFANETTISDRERELVEVVADHVAIAAERTALVQELRRANAALVDTNAELERQYAEVVAARGARDRFLGHVAAGLRSPLEAARTRVADVLADGATLPSTVRDALTSVQRTHDRLVGITDDLVQLAALKRGDVPLVVEDVDPGTPLRAAVARLRRSADATTIRVVEPTVQLPPVRSDARGIEAVLVRVLAHAVDCAHDGRVEASFDVGRGWVAWRVAHDAPPLAADAGAHAFDEFRPFDANGALDGAAVVGRLPLARRWAERLGGDLRLDAGSDHASVFTFILPLDANVEHRPVSDE
jgi:signal transduction histidine kinase